MSVDIILRQMTHISQCRAENILYNTFQGSIQAIIAEKNHIMAEKQKDKPLSTRKSKLFHKFSTPVEKYVENAVKTFAEY